MIIALAGGVGGAKLALGLTRVLAADELAVVVNTGDDFEHLGLHISPDIDTVTYTLAGIANPETGWGLAGESWSFMAALGRLGGETWFQLGDGDLATHIERTRRLSAGESLSAVTAALARRLAIAHPVLPMSDDPVRTMIVSGGRTLPFQDYFVRLRCEPTLDSLEYAGGQGARPSPSFLDLMERPDLEGVVLCPSNPYLSIGPMLAMPAVRGWLEGRRSPVAAVSPIVGGQAIKGPAAKILRELGQEVSPVSVARFYEGLIDALVIDEADGGLTADIARLGIRPVVTRTIMRDHDDKERLARDCLAAVRGV
ncbi:2-phospho-L-lactate transferase [Azospirillum sp. TSO5]|uniref:2-phospho-L-lactate transferase n=1 Tax=Azospirillum sp. TSO5 TaxID=716760 RepID=UPI000D608302|nr:2-phospho-L-lactate transferase [Azospirillum sp. TSO5]PWC94111.1 2-phospho-L-lactate transferase [Azospirillum sp. TSO5]